MTRYLRHSRHCPRHWGYSKEKSKVSALICACVLKKKALGNNKFTNKCRHLGDNKAVSKQQEVFRVAQGPDGKAGQRKGEWEAKGADEAEEVHLRTSTEPAWRGQRRGRRKVRDCQKKHHAAEGLKACWDLDTDPQWGAKLRSGMIQLSPKGPC